MIWEIWVDEVDDQPAYRVFWGHEEWIAQRQAQFIRRGHPGWIVRVECCEVHE